MARDELVVVDLGELSNTHFGKSVTAADMHVDEAGDYCLKVEAGMVKLNFKCEQERAVGTYVIFDQSNAVIGTSSEIIRIRD